MYVNVYAAYRHVLERELKGLQAAVIDTLRATSVIITALNNGARAVVPVAEVEQAVERYGSMRDSSLMGGERNALKIPGFHLSNSPYEYTPQTVQGKTVILTTTNGTRALQRAASARKVWVAAMLNATAVAKTLLDDGGDASIVCAGTKERFSIDDVMTAGCILSRMYALDSSVQTDDLGWIAMDLYERNKKNPMNPLKHAAHYAILQRLNLMEDVAYCMQTDTIPVVPRFEDGIITL